ncbi:32240_t:CDS:2, partial [Gigaspora margarita]
EDAIKNLLEMHVANLEPNCNLGDNAGYICLQSLPGFGSLYKFSPLQLQKITKNYVFEKPNPSLTIYTQPTKNLNHFPFFYSSQEEVRLIIILYIIQPLTLS